MCLPGARLLERVWRLHMDHDRVRPWTASFACLDPLHFALPDVVITHLGLKRISSIPGYISSLPWYFFVWWSRRSSGRWVVACSEMRRTNIFKFYQADDYRTLLWALSKGFIDLPTPIFGTRSSIWTPKVKMRDFQHFCKIGQIGIFIGC